MDIFSNIILPIIGIVVTLGLLGFIGFVLTGPTWTTRQYAIGFWVSTIVTVLGAIIAFAFIVSWS